nr:SUMF1/EgtB/PvdO family nonheme iron enzyme [Nitrospirota bacterium]
MITAGAADQEVIESAQWGHSVFTYFLLKGLNEGLADQDDNGVITSQELYTYLESRVFGEAKQQGHTQTPQMAELSGEKGQFVFFTSARGKGSSPALASTGSAGASTDEMARMRAELEALKAQMTKPAEVSKPMDVAKAPAYEAPRQTGREITGKDGASMLLVPEGEFLYGDSNQKLSLPAFYMDKYEVTTKLYATFLQATSRKQPDYWDRVNLTSMGDRPVGAVDWNDADAYCHHYGKRLPTEQEWEKAARGTDGRKYPWGNDEPSSRYANIGQPRSDDRNFYRAGLTDVGYYEAGKSPYGIYDLAGNVWEWTSSDHRTIASGHSKVRRGGSWNYPLSTGKSTHRSGDNPIIQDPANGFRCAQDAS